jgi:regulator of sirC expression with transglutaminase-like and TPR domain
MDPSQPEEIAAHEQRARENLLTYTEIAANARKFWELERERLLVVDPMKDQTSSVQMDDATKRRYEERIANTIKQEVAVRRALFETLLYVNRFPEAITEANTILTLEPGVDQVLYDRAGAYLYLQPPDRRSALRDYKEYRSRLPMDQLTDEMVQLNVAIKRLESELAKEKQPQGG